MQRNHQLIERDAHQTEIHMEEDDKDILRDKKIKKKSRRPITAVFNSKKKQLASKNQQNHTITGPLKIQKIKAQKTNQLSLTQNLTQKVMSCDSGHTNDIQPSQARTKASSSVHHKDLRYIDPGNQKIWANLRNQINKAM